MKRYVVGNVMDVGEEFPEVTVQVVHGRRAAIEALLTLPRLWGVGVGCAERAALFAAQAGADPWSLSPDAVAAAISAPGSLYFARPD